MRFTTKTEYGLICLVYLARHADKAAYPVTIKELVDEEGLSQTYIEKILQALRNAGILKAQHGNQGGYLLARPASKITLKDVIEVLEGVTFEVFCESKTRRGIDCAHFPRCNVRSVWHKTKAVLDEFYGALTLEMIAAKDVLDFDSVRAVKTNHDT